MSPLVLSDLHLQYTTEIAILIVYINYIIIILELYTNYISGTYIHSVSLFTPKYFSFITKNKRCTVKCTIRQVIPAVIFMKKQVLD